MSSIPNVDGWKWFHSFYAIGVPMCVGVFFIETPPLIGHLFWIPFWLAFVWIGGFGHVSTKRVPYRNEKHALVVGKME
ncbi:hypothetical protein DA442_10255 [Vibrio parahaemolyticus]|nr:hypothetical protein [Vibrio parahaemolyticus]AVW95480.1 hypothetical protein DA442_10255 [Vibrio parahaemolyticus]